MQVNYTPTKGDLHDVRAEKKEEDRRRLDRRKEGVTINI